MGSAIDILASYLPGFVIDRINAAPSATNEPHSETFPAVVLFADISGFTALTEMLAHRPDGAEELTRRLNRYFGRLIDLIVLHHHGDVVKFAGDALLAVWRTTEEELAASTLAAVRCGLEVQQSLAELEDDDQLALKINIAAGRLRILEVGGVFDRWDWTVCGRPLMEIESNPPAEPHQVVVAEPTWKLIEQHCRVRRHTPTTLQILNLTTSSQPSEVERAAIRSDGEPRLRSYLPFAVLSRIQAGQDAWLSELRRVTVLFVNLRGINHETPLGTAQNAARSLQEAVYRYEGSVNKFSVDEKGTTLVAVFGLPPLTHADDAARGVGAALAIQQTLAGQQLPNSVGVCTGRVFCGSVGNQTRREYTVLGDVVNLAARLMQAAKDSILCDHETRQHAQCDFEFETLNKIHVKGKQAAIPVFRPLGARSEQRDAATQMIGRCNLQNQLLSAIESFVDRPAHGMTLVLGELGMGKTHFVNSVLDHQAHARVVTGAADAAERSTPYFAWRSVFRQLFEFDAGDPAAGRNRIREMLGEDEWFTQREPLLNALLSTDIPETELTAQLTGDVRAENTRELMLRILQRAAAQQPLVIAMEDIHWWDSVSWAVLSGIRRREVPVHVVLITRLQNENPSTNSEFRELLADETVTRLALDGLNHADTDALICECLGADRVSAEVSSWIFDRSDGHPYYTRELTLTLEDRDAVTVERGNVRLKAAATALAALGIPDSLEGVINSRLDRLPPQECMVLKSASVIGLDFSRDLLLDIHPIPEDRPQIPQLLNSLQDKSLTRPAEQAGLTIWEFQHTMTREVAYRLLLFAQRRKLHLAIANWYERQTAIPSADFPRLAWHWAHAENQQKAFEYFSRAGSYSLQQGAHSEARVLLEEALKRLVVSDNSEPALRREAATLERRLGEACLELGDLKESTRRLRSALRLLGHPEPGTAVGRAFSVSGILLWQLARRWKLVGRSPSGTETFREAARSCALLCEVYYLANESLRFFHASLHMHKLAQKFGPSRELALANAINCLTAGTIPVRPLARTYLKRARQEERVLNDAQASARIMLMAGVHHVSNGEWSDAREALEYGMACCERLEDYRNHGVLS
ncbi:MAG: AAA family ATPase, partial [Planctomycetaceae bacterium]|nr:AAA family ATPase [Planctomycetaceae bacterium]